MLPPKFTMRPVLRADKANSQGLCPIVIVVTVAGHRSVVSTGLRITPDQWSNGRIKAHPNAVLYNSKLTALLNAKEAEILNGKGLEGLNDHTPFLPYAEKMLAELDFEPGTRRRWNFWVEEIRKYSPKVTWSEINGVWLHNFNRHLLTPRKDRKGVSQNTARGAFVFIRRIFNEANSDGTTKLYPFGREGFSIPTEKSSAKEYLTFEELDRLEKLLDNDGDPATMAVLSHFLLESYSGIRHGDWSRWQTDRLIKGERFRLVTMKTGQDVVLPLSKSPRLKRVVDFIQDNGIVYTYSNEFANRVLKVLAAAASIKKNLTTHVGRHTAATLLLETGHSRETVAAVLGVSIKIIDTYAHMTGQKVKTEYERLGGL